MKEEMIIAGFGGQGVMLMGKLLAYAGMKEGIEVSWMPSYGPEMRGGTANCTVIMSSNKIPSPLSSKPDTIIVMNLPSLEKFAPRVKPGGTIFVNSSLIEKEVDRDDVEVIKVPANELANELGNSKVANMVMLGAYLSKKDVVDLNTVKDSLKSVLSRRHHKLIPINEKALDTGVRLN
ncbi:2-oxoacid:acceptor oxidoreductase family protein [Halothermothrix orenii]|uniref:3-methyl-2-oxobutanoate dehydrogenase (Ferredoxin), gamma subunit n=1 Tax=Halothermothrix orenii (strain H 168 / OCM 544 / DSM 9562) TaxID=373903 RepID=B8CVW8_HALOH|nr:2-oxoacid:acceptor oxidoreductase family protein [Halothermothrix orenii]ACL69437.1 3-methyl-2-oxobutanoate dehydrogenase (ferredoxin), gamma subunit [Halothermothrix orenii H 168]